MFKKFLKPLSLILALSILSIGGSILINSAIASWSSPTDNPPSGDISSMILASITIGTTADTNGIARVAPATATEGLRIISSDYSPFVIRNTANNADLFRIDEDGVITAKSDYLPIAGTKQLATADYVDAAGGGGDATLAKQEDMLDNQSDILSIVNTVISNQNQIISEIQTLSAYITETTSQLTYSGSTHTGQDCLDSTGVIYDTGESGTLCKVTGSTCPSGWAWVANWQRYSQSSFDGDSCGRQKGSAPTSFSNTSATRPEYTGDHSWQPTNSSVCENFCSVSEWCDVNFVQDNKYALGTPTANSTQYRVEVGCK